MKKLLLVAAIAALAPMPAMAIDGTITVNGQVTTATCKIGGAASPAAIAVTLPTVSTTALNTLGATAGNKLFTIALTECGTSLTRAITYFEHGPNIDTGTGFLKNTAAGGAGNVQVRLLNGDMSPIKLHLASGAQESSEATITSGAANLNYYAQYYALGQATAGTVSTSVQFTMQYQ
ncbi:fimbrial protein [Lysobacter cavernae]|uniref:Fimbrial protein n=1 Tax=Lysobacter cavernae TaxID=1685901 RepID=A0ABV7RRC1_9GAMM